MAIQPVLRHSITASLRSSVGLGGFDFFSYFKRVGAIVASDAEASDRDVQQPWVLDLDGVNDRVDLGAISLGIDESTAYIECTFKGVTAGNDYLVSPSTGGSSASCFFGLKVLGNKLTVNLADGASFEVLSSTTVLNSTTWYTVRVEIIAGFVRFTINGSVEDIARTIVPAYQNNNWGIGVFGASGILVFNGSIAHVKIGDATTNYGQYNLNESSGTIAYDSSGSDNHGTLANGASWVVDATLPPEADVANLVGYSVGENIAKYSEDITGGSWVVNNVTRATNTEIAPDGELTADTATFTSGSHTLRNNVTVSPLTEYTFSFYAKRGTMANQKHQVYNITGAAIISAATSYASEISTDEWSRVSVTFTTPAGCNNVYVYYAADSGSAGTLHVWGCQVVAGSEPLTYYKTEATALTKGTLIPLNGSLDIFGNTPTALGSVYPTLPEYRGSYAGEFDGSSSYVNIPVGSSAAGVFGACTISGYFNADAIAGTYWAHGTSAYRLIHIGANLFVNDQDTGYAPTLNEWAFYEVDYDTNGIGTELRVNGLTEWSGSGTAGSAGGQTNFYIGGRYSATVGYLFNGSASNLIISGFGEYSLSEGVGATLHDISGNGNDGTITNASTATEGAGFWAGRIDGEANAHNINNGFSRRMLFDGVDDEVRLDDDAYNTETLGYVSADITYDGSGGVVFGVASSTAAGEILLIETKSNNIRINDGGVNIVRGTTTLVAGGGYNLKWESTGSAWKLYIDGVEETLVVSAGSNTGSWFDLITSGVTRYSVGVLKRSSGDIDDFSGVIWNVLVNDGVATIGQWNGNGNTNADWLDTVGSNNGTVNGSPALLRVPADSAAPTLDVYGDTLTNPSVAPRPNDSESTEDCKNITEGGTPTAATNDLTANVVDPEAIAFSDNDISGDITPNGSVFRRDKSSTEKDRLYTFDAPLTGSDLALLERYTE